MAWTIPIIIIALPLIEVAIFVEVGQEIGFVQAILLAVVAGLAGLAVLRHQSFAAIARAKQSLDRGEPPVREVFNGACLLVAGAFLLLPGFLTDVIGIALLVPQVRAALLRWLGARIDRAHARGEATVIEVEYHQVEDGDDEPTNPDSSSRRP